MAKNKIKLPKIASLQEKLSRSLSLLKEKMPKAWQPYLIKKNFLIVFIVLFFLVQYMQVSKVTGGISSLANSGSSLVDEVGQLNEVTAMLAQDLTEVRGFLLLPTRQYASSLDFEESSREDSNEDNLQVALFKYVGFLGEQENLKQKMSMNSSYLDALYGDKFSAFLDSRNLSFSKRTETDDRHEVYLLDEVGNQILYFYLEKETGNLHQATVGSLDMIITETEDEFLAGAEEFLTDNLSSLLSLITQVEETKEYVIDSFSSEEIAELLEAEKLTFISEPNESEAGLLYDIENYVGEVVAQVSFVKADLAITLVDIRDEDNIILQVTDLATALPPFIEKLDVLPAVQKKIMEAQLGLKETFEDKGFRLLLEETGLYVEFSPREDEYRFYYDIRLGETDGTLLGSVVIEKNTGMIEVVDPTGADTVNLLFFEEGLKKKLQI
jgi:hypothetical protein